jgi:DNA-binding MurR/RpiR family transcriptional regulator
MFKERIREYYEGLTPGFRKLADFIMTHTMDAAFLTATEMARTVGVDPATVVRFSQEMGYSGYRELSREIKSYVRAQVTATSKKVKEAETEEDLLGGLMEHTYQNLEYFMTTEKELLTDVVKVLKDAPHVWITGEGPSYNIAGFFAAALEYIGLSATAFYAGMLDGASALMRMAEGDVVLAFVLGSPSVDVGYVINQAKEKGLKVVCVTGSGVAMPAREADLTVLIPMRSPLGLPSFGGAMTVVALIWETIASEQAEETKSSRDEVEDYMTTFLKLRANTEQYDVISLKAEDTTVS